MGNNIGKLRARKRPPPIVTTLEEKTLLARVLEQDTLTGIAGVIIGSSETMISNLQSNDNFSAKKILKDNIGFILPLLVKNEELSEQDCDTIYNHIDSLHDNERVGTPRSVTPVTSTSDSPTSDGAPSSPVCFSPKGPVTLREKALEQRRSKRGVGGSQSQAYSPKPASDGDSSICSSPNNNK